MNRCLRMGGCVIWLMSLQSCVRRMRMRITMGIIMENEGITVKEIKKVLVEFFRWLRA